MKRSERHHLKENELAHSLDRAREQFEAHKNRIVGIGVLVTVVVVVAAGYVWYRQRVEGASRTMLATAMAIHQAQVVPPTPPPAPGQPAPATAPAPPPPGSYPTEQAKLNAALPKFMEAAEAHPSSSAGIAARYEAAACLLQLGRAKDAIDRYREVIDRDGNGLYGDMARMGLGEAQIATGQYDAAIASYRELTSKPTVPTDAVLMQLGRAYAKAGKKTEAERTFKRIMDEFPQSQYAQAAKKEMDATKAPAA
jgi:TolA-binding protein